MNQKSLLARIALVFAFFVFSARAVVFNEIVPPSAPPNADVEMRGAEFANDATLALNGVQLQIVSRAADRIVFRSSAAAGSGLIVLWQGGETHTNYHKFIVGRTLNGRVELPAAMLAGYEISGADVRPINADGTFAATVAMDEVAVIWAVRNDNDPALMALVTPEMTGITVNARTTAEALILSTPGIRSRDPELVAAQRTRLAAIAETQQLADVIGAVASAGRDYLDDARVVDLWTRAATAILTPAAPGRPRAAAFEPGTPRNAKLKYLNPLAGVAGYPDIHRLKATFTEPDAHLPDAYRLKMESADRFPLPNPVDWIVEMYELDPNQFSEGFTSVDALNHLAVPVKMRAYPDDTAIVSASLVFKKLDLLDLAVGFVTDAVFGATVNHLFATGPDEVAIPSNTAGIYVTESYSGNLWWGTGLFNSPQFQNELIDQLGRRPAFVAAFVANTVVLAVDIAGIIVPLDTFLGDPKDYQEVLYGVIQDVLKAMAIHNNHPLTAETFYDLVKNSVASIVKNTIAKASERAPDITERARGFTRRLKGLAKALDVLAKISSGAQAVERGAGLLVNTVLAVERNVTIVGDPFGPRIDSFEPLSGRGGETLLIQGANFSPNRLSNRVQFAQFAGTDDPTRPTATLDLEVLGANANTLAVYVPTNGLEVFTSGRAFIIVNVIGKPGTGNTFALNPPEFRIIPLATVTGVHPSPAIAGSMIEIRGENFDPDIKGQTRIDFNNGAFQTYATAMSANKIIAWLPAGMTAGTYAMKVRFPAYETAPINVTVAESAFRAAGEPGSGMEIMILKPDMSNEPDGLISVLEGILIANGTLGRPIEDHLPCEYLSPFEPGYCEWQRREIDSVRDYTPNGASRSDRVYVHFTIGRSAMTGAMPPLSSRDSYSFEWIEVDGAGAAGPALSFDGVSETYVANITLKNFTGTGVDLKNGAKHNWIENVRIENAGAHGLALTGDAQFNYIYGFSVSNAIGHGVLFSGPAVSDNNFNASGGGQDIFSGTTIPFTRIEKAGGNGIRVENGANHNTFSPGTVRENGGAGILVTGEDSDHNYFGRSDDQLYRLYDVVKNGGPGVHLTAGVQGTVFRYIAAGGNRGDGFLLEGEDCAFNHIDRPFVGVNYYEGGTDRLLPNEGSGIHLRDGAHHNLIGGRVVSLGLVGTISGNRDDGILIEGANTAFNTVSEQRLGMVGINYNPLRVDFGGNGGAGIRIRNGSHHNRIGSFNRYLNNVYFDAREAGLVIEGSGTSDNIVAGNQFGAHFGEFSTDTGWNRIGILVRNGANGNQIGLPGSWVQLRDGTILQPWNVVNRSSEVGIQIENTSGQVGTDGVLTRANLIQNNHIGEEDTGNIARNNIGLKLGAEAYANVIGGPTPLHGNRIVGPNKYGFWIENNNIPSPRLRNRIYNNLISQTQGPLRYNDYLNTTPASGIGLYVQNSSGHVIGENLKWRNTLYVNRIGAYFENSSSNVFQGNLVTNQFIAAIVVRGGEKNQIGSAQPQLANEITAFGLREEGPQAGVVLSETRENKVLGNLIGHLAPGRGGYGIRISNAQNNQIGGVGAFEGNVIVSNSTSGVVISGPQATGNGLFGNFIGVDRNRVPAPNTGDGVALWTGASGNQIGGFLNAPAPFGMVRATVGNTISHNTSSGVSVDGATTTGNSILFNCITANGWRGIQHLAGGNRLIPPPTLLTFNGKTVTGTVPDLAQIPPGSRVQLFTDPDPADPEGDAYIGQAMVGTDGSWKADVFSRAYFPQITMTATHATDGSTSEFGVNPPIEMGLRVARTDGTPNESVAAGTADAPVFRVSLTAINADVAVKALSIDAAGTLPDATAVMGARLINDIDRDGRVSPGDQEITGRIQFPADDGRLTFAISNQVVEASFTAWWIVAFDMAAAAPGGADFTLSVEEPESVEAEFLYPPRVRVAPAGSFSVDSARFTVGAGPVGQTLAAWKARVFTAAQLSDPNISGNEADPDGDGVINALEYAFNLNPLLSDRNGENGIPKPTRVNIENQEYLRVTFVRRAAPVDVRYTAQISEDLSAWTDIDAAIAETTVFPGTIDGQALEEVALRLLQPIRSATRPQFVRVRVELMP